MPRPSLAEEAILLASPNTTVADYLVKRGEEKRGHWSGISEEAEGKLLDRADRLVDLRLAEYCLYPSTGRTLFLRNPDDWAVRSLVLSNCAVATTSFIHGFPQHLFGSEEALRDFLSIMSPDDAMVLFGNPTLDNGFLKEVLSLGELWEAIKSDTRPFVLSGLAANPKLHKNVRTSDFDDGWDWYTAGQPFAAAWRLTINLEVNDSNAYHLSQLYEQLAPYCPSREDIAEALPRWFPQSDEELAAEREKNAKKQTSDYQDIRRAVAAMLLRQNEIEKDELLASEDVSVRCGAYAAGAFTPEEIEEAIERDNWFAAQSFLKNPLCWKTSDHREQVAKGLPSDDETAHWMYRRHAEKYEAEHPEWFDFDESVFDEKEVMLSEISLNEFTKSFASDSSPMGMNAKITKLEKTQQFLLALLIGGLILQVVLH